MYTGSTVSGKLNTPNISIFFTNDSKETVFRVHQVFRFKTLVTAVTTVAIDSNTIWLYNNEKFCNIVPVK